MGRCPGVGADNLQLPLENLVPASSEESVELLSAEAKKVEAAFWHRQDALNSTGLITNLNAQPRCRVESSIAIYCQAAGVRVFDIVRCVQPVKALFGIQSSITIYLKIVYPAGAPLSGVQ